MIFFSKSQAYNQLYTWHLGANAVCFSLCSYLKVPRLNTSMNQDSEDSNYLPLSEDEVILGNEDFIMPEEPLEQERFKRQLIATARSLKKKQQQLRADQDLLNVDGLMSWKLRSTASSDHSKVTRSTNCYLNSMTRRWSPGLQYTMLLTDHHVVGKKAATQDDHQPALPRCKGRDKTSQGYTYDLRQGLKNKTTTWSGQSSNTSRTPARPTSP